MITTPANSRSSVTHDPASTPSAAATRPPELTARDREWLALYLGCNEDLRALAARLATQHAAPGTEHDTGPSAQVAESPWRHSGPSILDLANWLRSPPIRAALADWDYAQRRARAARDEADRRVAIDALKAACSFYLSSSCHRLAPSGDSLHTSTPSTKHAGAALPTSRSGDPCHRTHPSHETHSVSADTTEPPSESAPSASSADHSASPASEFDRFVELRRSATTLLRALTSGIGLRPVVRRHAGPAQASRHRKPRRIADFNLGPADAEKFLERERRENDRLEKLIQRAVALSDAAHGSALAGGEPPSDHLERSREQTEESPWRPPRVGGRGSPQRSEGEPQVRRGGTEGACSPAAPLCLDHPTAPGDAIGINNALTSALGALPPRHPAPSASAGSRAARLAAAAGRITDTG